MKRLKVKLSFTSFSKSELITFVKSILKKMQNNVLFPNPDVSLADIATALNLFE